MVDVKLTFPWGRYYAHPWGLNPVRLRESEWPPSPWRLLRAMAAGWFQAYPGLVASDELRMLLKKLGSELPDIAIGPVAFSQTVHWQPNYGNADKTALHYGRTRYENHFAATESPVLFRWSGMKLAEDERLLLSSALLQVAYFGRAESLCRMELTEGNSFKELGWCRPYRRDSRPARRIAEDCRDVFCPDPANFQADDLWSRRAKRAEMPAESAPPHLVEDLLSSQPLPDGARWITYQMPDGWPGKWIVRVPRTRDVRLRRVAIAPRVANYLRFALQCRVPIPLKFTVPVAEQFRSRAIWHFSKIAGGGASSFALSGHDRPQDAKGEHQHAFYLPFGVEAGHSRLLSDLHVWSAYGFTKDEIDALTKVERLEWGNGRYPIRPILVAVRDNVSADTPIADGQISAKVWRSITPFVPPRYFYRGSLHGAKVKNKDSPERQLVECIRLTGIVTPGEIRRLTTKEQRQASLPPLADWDVVRAPKDDEAAANGVVTSVHTPKAAALSEKTRRIGFFFELAFDAPVAFPIPALGHSSHFGLGLFRVIA